MTSTSRSRCVLRQGPQRQPLAAQHGQDEFAHARDATRRAREPLDQVRRALGAVVLARPRGQLARPSRDAGLRQRASDRQPHPARRREAPRQPHARAGPVEPRRVLGHVAGDRAGDDRRAGGAARAPSSRARRGRPRPRSAASCARRRSTRPAACSPAPRSGRRHGRRFHVASTRTGSPSRPASAARSRRCSRSCAVEGATSTSGVVARRRLDVLGRRLPQQRAYDVRPTPASRADTPAAGTSPTRQSRSLSPPWTRSTGASPSRARASLSSRLPCSQARAHERVEPLPQAPAERGPRQTRAERVRRRAGWRCGMHVRDQRRDRHPLQLACKRRPEREDVGDDDVRARPPRRRPRVGARRARPPRTASAGRASSGRPGTPAPARTPCPRPRRRPRHRAHVSNVTAWPRLASADPSASIGNAWPGIAEGAEEQAQRLVRPGAGGRSWSLVALMSFNHLRHGCPMSARERDGRHARPRPAASIRRGAAAWRRPLAGPRKRRARRGRAVLVLADPRD